MPLAGKKFQVDVAQTLTANLIAYWKLDEASGNRADTVGDNTLVDGNTVASSAGIITGSNSALFVAAASESFSVADNTDLSTGDIDYSFSCWVNMATTGFGGVLAKFGAAGNREHYLAYRGPPDNAFEFYMYDGLDGSNNVIGTVTPATSTWLHIIVTHDAANDLLGIAMNGGALATSATTVAPQDSTAAFTMGQRGDAGTFWNGEIDEVGFWKKVLSTQEITDLYNSGAGNTLIDTSAVVAARVPTNPRFGWLF